MNSTRFQGLQDHCLLAKMERKSGELDEIDQMSTVKGAVGTQAWFLTAPQAPFYANLVDVKQWCSSFRTGLTKFISILRTVRTAVSAFVQPQSKTSGKRTMGCGGKSALGVPSHDYCVAHGRRMICMLPAASSGRTDGARGLVTGLDLWKRSADGAH